METKTITSPQISAPAAWTVLGAGVVAASAAVIAQPGFSLGALLLSLVLLVSGRVMGEMGLVVFLERVSGLGPLFWELLCGTRMGGWVARRMTNRGFGLLASLAAYLFAVSASQGVGDGNLSVLSVGLSLFAGLVYVVWHGVGERLAKAYVEHLAPAKNQTEL